MENSEVMGMVALIVSVAGTIIGLINHRRIRSSCNKRVVEVSLDIESTAVAPAPKDSATIHLDERASV